MLARTLAIATVALLALAGCTTETPTPAPVPTTTPSATILNPDLVPQALPLITEETVSVEASRLADALQALVGDELVTGAADEAQVFPSADDLPPYYGLQRVLTIDPSYDNVTLAQTLTAVLEQSGWTLYQASDEGGVSLAALSGGPVDTPWFLILEGKVLDGVSTITFSLASPDLAA